MLSGFSANHVNFISFTKNWNFLLNNSGGKFRQFNPEFKLPGR